MKLLFLVTEDWYFHSHRLPMARAAQKAGFDVGVITNVTRHKDAIEKEGIRVIPLSLDRRSLNPFRALFRLKDLAAIYRHEKPDVVHHIAMKPVLLGSLAAMSAGVPAVINAFAGLGYIFAERTPLARLLRMAAAPAFRMVLKRDNSRLLLQNDDDRMLLERLGMTPDRTLVIRGSGVDMDVYKPTPLPDPHGEFICAFAGRMIDIKGLPTLREAFLRLAQTHPHIRLWLCGEPDDANPGSWTRDELEAWVQTSPNVVFKGRCDMAALWVQAHLAVQPSWGGEGVPKSLLEALACGRAAVATDVPGCRDIVKDEVNGLLVPPRDAAALSAAIARLADDRNRLNVMAAHSRPIVESGFSAESISAQAERLYRGICASRCEQSCG